MYIIRQVFVLISLSFLLQGCIFVVGACAGAAAIAVVYDHRTISNSIKDSSLANKTAQRLNYNTALHNESHIEVIAFNRVLLLTGETPTIALRQQADEIAKSIPGVTRVYNQITIQGPTSMLTRTSDSWITAKIKAEMLAAENLKSSSIKVVTENGTVYLMGILSRQQADIAVEIARQVTGVQKVVKIFQYTN